MLRFLRRPAEAAEAEAEAAPAAGAALNAGTDIVVTGP